MVIRTKYGYRLSMRICQPFASGVGGWVTESKTVAMIFEIDTERVAKDFPFSIALKAKSALFGKESMKFGF